MSVPWILAACAVAWAAWAPLRAVASARFARAYPGVSGKLRWLFACMLLLFGLLAWRVPQAGWLVAGAALLLGVADRWRGRPAFGKSRAWPPGSLAMFPATWADDRFYLELAHAHGPIFKTSNFLRPTVCVVGLEVAARLLREHGDQLETPYLPFSQFVPGGMLRYMREPQHHHYRAIFRNAFAPAVIRGFEPVFREHTRRTLARLAADSRDRAEGMDPVPSTACLMLEMWLELFFAIRPGSDESRRLLGLYEVIDITNPLRARTARIREAVDDIRGILMSHRAGDPAQPPQCLWSVVREQNPADADDPVVIGNLIYMVSTTASDMSALLNWILKKACDHPDWLDRVAADDALVHDDQPALPEKSAAKAGAKSVAEGFVLETLRMRQSEFIYRAVIHDFDFAGFHIPRGWLLRICVWESHRDPGVFDHPDQFDPGRFLGRSFSRDEYSPFGISSHACLASFLVTSVAGTFVRELASAYRVQSSSKGSAAVLAATRHWAPGPGFRIQLQPRN